jgi:cell division septation protein DedD
MSSDRFDSGFEGEPLAAPRRGSGLDPTTKRLLLLAGGLGGVLVVILGLWGLGGRPAGPPPLITPEPGPVRVKPADPGGLKVDQDAAILEGGGKEGGETLITPAEKPAPEALAQAAATPPPETPPSAPAAPSGGPSSAPPGGTAAPAAPSPSAGAPSGGAGGAIAASPPSASSPAAGGLSAAPSRPAPAPSSSGTKTAALSSSPALAGTASHPAHAAGGTIAVQLAALGSEAAAHAEWERLLARHHDLLAKRSPEILRVSREGRVFYRLRVGGFASTEEAARFCRAFVAEGGACTVAAF